MTFCSTAVTTKCSHFTKCPNTSYCIAGFFRRIKHPQISHLASNSQIFYPVQSKSSTLLQPVMIYFSLFILIESAIKVRCLIKPVVLPVATIVYQNHTSFRDHVISLCKRQGWCYCSLTGKVKSNLLKISVDVHGSLRSHVASVGHTYPRVHMLIVGVLNWDHVILKIFCEDLYSWRFLC